MWVVESRVGESESIVNVVNDSPQAEFASKIS